MSVLIYSSFLGYVDKLGVAYETHTAASGYGAYIALVSVLVLLLSCA